MQGWRDAGMAIAVVAGIYFTSVFVENELNPYHVRVLVNCGIAAILAMSLNLVNGCAGQFSLGHAGFMGVGAYVSATFTTLLAEDPSFAFFQSPPGVLGAILLGGLAAGFAGYLVGLPSLRLKGDYLAIVTLGFGEIIRIVFLNVQAVGGARGLPGIPRAADFFWVYTWVALTLVVLWRLIRSSTGRAILALRDDEIAAESVGIAVSRYKVFAFTVSSFFAGVAGGLFAHFQGFIDPNSFNFNRSVDVVVMVVLGGMGSFSGSILGALLVTILPETLRVFEQYRMIVFPTVLIAVMLLRPMGVMGHRELWQVAQSWWHAGKARKKARVGG